MSLAPSPELTVLGLAAILQAGQIALAAWSMGRDGLSKWNAGPRDPEGKPGAYEAALEDNTQLHDPTQPIEILRTIHSFDPCIACAVHVTDPASGASIEVAVA